MFQLSLGDIYEIAEAFKISHLMCAFKKLVSIWITPSDFSDVLMDSVGGGVGIRFDEIVSCNCDRPLIVRVCWTDSVLMPAKDCWALALGQGQGKEGRGRGGRGRMAEHFLPGLFLPILAAKSSTAGAETLLSPIKEGS